MGRRKDAPRERRDGLFAGNASRVIGSILSMTDKPATRQSHSRMYLKGPPSECFSLYGAIGLHRDVRGRLPGH